jgi:hypothetical protein
MYGALGESTDTVHCRGVPQLSLWVVWLHIVYITPLSSPGPLHEPWLVEDCLHPREGLAWMPLKASYRSALGGVLRS